MRFTVREWGPVGGSGLLRLCGGTVNGEREFSVHVQVGSGLSRVRVCAEFGRRSRNSVPVLTTSRTGAPEAHRERPLGVCSWICHVGRCCVLARSLQTALGKSLKKRFSVK